MTSHFQDGGGHDVIHAEKCCHLASEHEATTARLCSSVRQFLTNRDDDDDDNDDDDDDGNDNNNLYSP